MPAILEHEAIAGLTASKPAGLRGRASSNARDLEEDRESMHSLDTLMRTVSSVTGFHSNSTSNMAITAAGKDLSLLYLPPYDAEKRIQALETKDLGKLVRISC